MSTTTRQNGAGSYLRYALAALLSLELGLAGAPMTALAKDGGEAQETMAQAIIEDGASLGASAEEGESGLLEGHLYLYQGAENPYFSDGALQVQAATPGLEDKLTEEECNTIKSAIIQVAEIADPAYYVTLSNCSLTVEEVQALIMDVVNTHPEFWYVDSSINYDETYEDSGIVSRFYLRYMATGDDLAAKRQIFDQNMASLLSWVPTTGTTAEKVKAVHDWLVRNVSYDEPAQSIYESSDANEYRRQTGRDPWSAYGAVVDHIAVCQGYSQAFVCAMAYLDIEAGIVTTATHQWNRVKVDGNWYHIDVNWDDPIPDQGFDTTPDTCYFLKSDTGVMAEDPVDHQSHKNWQLPKPECTDTTYDSYKTADWPTYSGPAPVGTQDMYRLYNPNSGEHFYTVDASERDNLKGLGWNYEGIGWVAPTAGEAVYRLYNANGGEHHYTTDASEMNMLVGQGWKYEGIGWFSDPNQKVPLYRQYNPNAFSCNHNYTTSLDENDFLVSKGWHAEGVGWYAVEEGRPA